MSLLFSSPVWFYRHPDVSNTVQHAMLVFCFFMQVVGVDFCGRFIDAAMKIQNGKVLQYGSQQVAKLPSEADPSHVQFKQVHKRGF